MYYAGQLHGHSGAITSLACPVAPTSSAAAAAGSGGRCCVVSASRDGSIVVWGRLAPGTPAPRVFTGRRATAATAKANSIASSVAASPSKCRGGDGGSSGATTQPGSSTSHTLETPAPGVVHGANNGDDTRSDGGYSVASSSASGSRHAATVGIEGTSSGGGPFAVPLRRLEGHADFIQNVVLSSAAKFALTASWDRSLRLWDLADGTTVRKFIGHTKDVLACAFSPDDAFVASGGRDMSLRVWATQSGTCVTAIEGAHEGWVSCVRFASTMGGSSGCANWTLLSGGWDNTIKVWSLTAASSTTGTSFSPPPPATTPTTTGRRGPQMLSQSPASSIVVPGTAEGTESNLCVRCVATLTGHTGYITSIAASPDGSLCASSSKDGTVRLWDLVSATCLYDIVCGSAVHQVAFCPTRFWLAAAAEQSVQIYNLETRTVIAELIPQSQSRRSRPVANSVAWALDGGTLYSGYTDNNVRVWRVGQLG